MGKRPSRERRLAWDRGKEAVGEKPLRIQMVGLLPLILQPCGAACAQPFMNRPVQAMSHQEHAETPEFVEANGARAHAIAEQLFRDFGDEVRIEVVGLDSFRGLILGLRHRFGKGFAIVVGGGEVVRNPGDYESVKAVVARALATRQPAAS